MLPWQTWRRRRALATDDPYEACLRGITEHPNYGNCLKCSNCDYCERGILAKQLALVEEDLKITDSMLRGEKLTYDQMRTFMSEEEVNEIIEIDKLIAELDESWKK